MLLHVIVYICQLLGCQNVLQSVISSKDLRFFLSIELHRKEVDKESDQSELIVNTERYV